MKVVPPLEPGEKAVFPMSVDDPSTPRELSATQMIENVFGDLKLKTLGSTIGPSKVGEDVEG